MSSCEDSVFLLIHLLRRVDGHCLILGTSIQNLKTSFIMEINRIINVILDGSFTLDAQVLLGMENLPSQKGFQIGAERRKWK